MKMNPSERLQVLRDDLNTRKTRIADIAAALIASGYTSLNAQAKALGLHRNTVWTIRNKKHKLGRLSAKTIERIIANPQTPPSVLRAVQDYVAISGCPATTTVTSKLFRR